MPIRVDAYTNTGIAGGWLLGAAHLRVARSIRTWVEGQGARLLICSVRGRGSAGRAAPAIARRWQGIT